MSEFKSAKDIGIISRNTFATRLQGAYQEVKKQALSQIEKSASMGGRQAEIISNTGGLAIYSTDVINEAFNKVKQELVNLGYIVSIDSGNSQFGSLTSSFTFDHRRLCISWS